MTTLDKLDSVNGNEGVVLQKKTEQSSPSIKKKPTTKYNTITYGKH